MTLLHCSESLPQSGYDAVLLLCGAQMIPEEGLVSALPLVIPRVHNSAALLLGGAQSYRSLFDRFAGRLCWICSGIQSPFFTTPKEDCSVLCRLVDTELGLQDPAVCALELAHKYGWDTFSQACDLSLLLRLLQGDWQGEDLVYVPANIKVMHSYHKDLIALG